MTKKELILIDPSEWGKYNVGMPRKGKKEDSWYPAMGDQPTLKKEKIDKKKEK